MAGYTYYQLFAHVSQTCLVYEGLETLQKKKHNQDNQNTLQRWLPHAKLLAAEAIRIEVTSSDNEESKKAALLAAVKQTMRNMENYSVFYSYYKNSRFYGELQHIEAYTEKDEPTFSKSKKASLNPLSWWAHSHSADKTDAIQYKSRLLKDVKITLKDKECKKTILMQVWKNFAEIIKSYGLWPEKECSNEMKGAMKILEDTVNGLAEIQTNLSSPEKNNGKLSVKELLNQLNDVFKNAIKKHQQVIDFGLGNSGKNSSGLIYENTDRFANYKSRSFSPGYAFLKETFDDLYNQVTSAKSLLVPQNHLKLEK